VFLTVNKNFEKKNVQIIKLLKKTVKYYSHLPRWGSRESCRRDDGKPIAVRLQAISDVTAVNPIVAFYDIHGRKGDVLFYYSVLDTTRDKNK
jgi:hypothetical protein